MPFLNEGHWKIHPDYERASVCRRKPSWPTTPSLLHPKLCTSSRLTPMVMRLPISHTGCAFQLSSTAHKPRFSAGLMARKPARPTMAAVIIDGALVSIGHEARITQAGDTRFFAGWRSDPFFCDVEGAKNNLQFTGDDFFADKDVCSIVLKYLTLFWGQKKFACGRARLRQVMAAPGSKWSAEPGLRKRSYLSKKEMPTSE